MLETTGKLLNANSILSAPDMETVREPVPEWGGDVLMKPLTAQDRDAFEASINDGETKNLDNYRARLVVRCIVQEDGTRMFTDSQANDLGRKNARVVDRLFAKCQAINGMGDADVKALVGNSDGGPIGDSPSSSPSNSDT